ncbi:electron transfer flavoprotein subunit alpha/FixB family protein, partial [Stappia taiwanensis]|nr:electron transfer flavoprotein subunit alpha/FixB family protein [Stappia taiwanensis]
MTTLLVAEHSNGALNEATHKAMTAAAALGGDVHVLVAGKDCRPAAEQAAKLSGAAKVLLADGDGLAEQLAEPMADLVLSLAEGYDAIVAPATANGKNILPRVAALLDV